MITVLEFYFNIFCNLYFDVYRILLIMFITGTSFLKGHYKTESFNLLYVANTFIPWVCLFQILNFTFGYFMAWYGQNNYEYYSFATTDTFTWERYFISMILPSILGLMFFARQQRSNRLFSFLYLLLISVGMIAPLIFYFYGGKFIADAAGGPMITGLKIIQMLIIILLLAYIYVNANKKNKLPYPSVLLK